MGTNASYRVERSGYESELFDVTISGVNSTDAEKLTATANRIVFGKAEAPATSSYAALSLAQLEAMDEQQQQAFIAAARLYHRHNAGGNKIDTIKFIRVISNTGLKAAKDLVEYAIDDFAGQPEWLKSTVPYSFHRPAQVAPF